jgi:hypothetical protein
MFNYKKFLAIIYGSGLMIHFNVMFYFLDLSLMFMVKIYGLWFNANYNRNVIGKVSYLIFEPNFHGYSTMYLFILNLT